MSDTVARSSTPAFVMQPQELPTWCWAAVATSCALFYYSQSDWTQCKVATASLLPPPGNCCERSTGASVCNKTWYLENEQKLGSFITTHIAGGFVAGALPYERLVSELDEGRPVAYRIEIQLEKPFAGQTSFAHFVVIAGYSYSGTDQQVRVYDSFFGDADMLYSVFIEGYKCHGGTLQGDPIDKATVTHSFFTVPPPNLSPV